MRASAALRAGLCLAPLLAGCSALAPFRRPEGGGGWSDVRRERELREIEQAVRAKQRGAEERLSAYETARVALGQAEENLRIRQQQFDVGRATSEDVLDVQALLEQQRATLASALDQAHTRRAELQQLMGRPLAELATGP